MNLPLLTFVACTAFFVQPAQATTFPTLTTIYAGGAGCEHCPAHMVRVNPHPGTVE